MRLALTVLFLVIFKVSYSQEYILGKSAEEVKSLMSEAKYKLLQSGVSSGIKFDDFNVGKEVEMLCYYDSDNICTRVRQIISDTPVATMIKELNYSNIAVKEKPKNWINLKKTMSIQLVKSKDKNKFALDYSLIP